MKVLNYQGKMIDPLNLKKTDLDNLGMQCAVTLSRLQRFWGQCRESYTVAQHCLSMVELFKGNKDLQKWALGHEIYEGLTSMDIPSPIKQTEAYKPYKEAEINTLNLFAKLYGLSTPIPEEIKNADKNLLVMEAEALMPYNKECIWRDIANPKGTLYKLGASEHEIRRDFLSMWQELYGKL